MSQCVLDISLTLPPHHHMVASTAASGLVLALLVLVGCC